jgi:hypothetical protein
LYSRRKEAAGFDLRKGGEWLKLKILILAVRVAGNQRLLTET